MGKEPPKDLIVKEPSDANGGRDLVGDTGRHVIESMPPGSPESEAMKSWIESVERRLGGGGGGGRRGGNSDPVPSHLRKTQQIIDFVKYLAMMLVGLITIGWLGHEYVSNFQTRDQAEESQAGLSNSITAVQRGVEDNEEAIGQLRIHNVRIELEQRQTNDRLDQLLELEQAATRSERREAHERVRQIQHKIDRRDRLMDDPRILRRLADQASRDPLGGLDGL